MFYVYTLTDPRTDEVFYVGKGKGRRAWTHEPRALAGRDRNGLKAEMIRSLAREGKRPLVTIVRDGLAEREALSLERAMIKEGRAALTNIASGSRTAFEVVQADIREDLHRLKPLCQLRREGASPDALAMWTRIRAGLTRLYAKAAI